MTAQSTMAEAKSKTNLRGGEWVWPIGLFLLAAIPRMIALQHFVTADEAKWVYRSAQFLSALLRGDLAGTAVNLTPAVTTTWLGSLGLSGYYALHRAEIDQPFTEWLTSLPQFRVDLPILAAVRWPMVIFAALATVGIYLVARRLWGKPLAVTGAILIALDPHTVALTRIIGHDAPAALFMTLSLLLLLAATMPSQTAPAIRDIALETRLGFLLLSGVMAGLAFLSKSPAFFLAPFATLLIVVRAGRQRLSWRYSLGSLAAWGVAAYLVFVALWPAAWRVPVSQPYAVVENGFLSATNQDDTEEAAADDEETYWRVANLGPLYYLVNGALKLSVPVTIGLILAVIGLRLAAKTGFRPDEARSDLLWLILFAGLFLAFMTLGGKRSNRYILPIFPALAFLAAFGWSMLPQLLRKRGRWQVLVEYPILVVSLLSLLLLLPYAPYYYTYLNPLLGGPLLAPRLVKIGWGEGLDEIGRWLESQPQPQSLRVGSYYASTLAPFFSGDIADPAGDRLDYVVSYLKYEQSGSPAPEIVEYYRRQSPLYSVRLAGIDYADIYPGPAVRPVGPKSKDFLNVVGYKTETNFAPIGQDWSVDLLWARNTALLETLPSLNLRSRGGIVARSDDYVDSVIDAADTIYHYTLAVPRTLPPSAYELYLGDLMLGRVEARYATLPEGFVAAEAGFGDQIRLVGFDPEPVQENDTLTIQLAFQAAPKAWADYTVFVHLIDPNGDRLAGFDAQPPTPASQWLKGEVVHAAYPIPLSPDLSPEQPYELRVGLYHPETFEPLGEPYILPLDVHLSER